MAHGVDGGGAVIDLDGRQREAGHRLRRNDNRRQRIALIEKLGRELASHQDQAVGMFLAHHVDMGRHAVLVVASIAHQHLETRFAGRFLHTLVDFEIKRVTDIANEKDDGVVGLTPEARRLRIGNEVRLPDGVENLLPGFRANLFGLLQRP
ncbi:hypothetical protein D3C78_820680 [compost metagenome]